MTTTAFVRPADVAAVHLPRVAAAEAPRAAQRQADADFLVENAARRVNAYFADRLAQGLSPYPELGGPGSYALITVFDEKRDLADAPAGLGDRVRDSWTFSRDGAMSIMDVVAKSLEAAGFSIVRAPRKYGTANPHVVVGVGDPAYDAALKELRARAEPRVPATTTIARPAP